MRVALLSDLINERWYSMDRYALALSSALAKVDPSLELSVIRPTGPSPRWTYRVHQLVTLIWKHAVYPLWARQIKADIYHILDHSYAHLAFRLPSDRTIITCHDLAPLVLQSSSRRLTDIVWRRSIVGLRRAARVLVDSANTASDVHHLLGISASRLKVVPLGVDARFRPTPSDLRNRLGIPNGRLLLHIGANTARKNLSLIIRALELLAPDVTLLQVGAAIDHPRIRSLAYLAEDDLPALYSLVDVFVFPSLYEGFGLPPLEAMACGTPVIVANTSSLPEVVGNAGLVVSPDDPQELAAAIQQVLTEPNLAATLRGRGLAQASQYTWDRTARATLAAYREVYDAATERH